MSSTTLLEFCFLSAVSCSLAGRLSRSRNSVPVLHSKGPVCLDPHQPASKKIKLQTRIMVANVMPGSKHFQTLSFDESAPTVVSVQSQHKAVTDGSYSLSRPLWLASPD